MQAELPPEISRILLEKDARIWHLKRRVEELERRDRDIDQVVARLQREHTNRLNHFAQIDSQEMRANLDKANRVIEYLNDRLRHLEAGTPIPPAPADIVEPNLGDVLERLHRSPYQPTGVRITKA